MKLSSWPRVGVAFIGVALAGLLLTLAAPPARSQPAQAPPASDRAGSATEQARQQLQQADDAKRIRDEAAQEIQRQEADKPPLDKLFPTSIDDLKAIQAAVQALLPKVYPATVSLQVGNSQGSGVIISEDGYVLTAGHVIARPGETVIVILDDGRRVEGESLGVDTNGDAGLVKISTDGPWPHVDMAETDDVHLGQWVVSVGHPGGYDKARGLVMRLGRVLDIAADAICTDCTLVGGDSGGPLFNMDGKVIGIHSRIGRTLTDNYHVPIKTFHADWTRLVAAEHWGDDVIAIPAAQRHPVLGVSGNLLGTICRVTQVHPDQAAARAGVRVNDQIASIDGEKVGNFVDVLVVLDKKKPGDTVHLEIVRDGKPLTLDVELGSRIRTMPGGPPRPPKEESSAPRGTGSRLGLATQTQRTQPVEIRWSLAA